MKGKEKCKALKEIRQKIAEENDIAYVVSECSHKGECKGTCPKCEAEVRYLERELARKEKLGKTIAVAGVALSVCTGLTACGPISSSLNQNGWDDGYAGGIAEFVESSSEELAGDVVEQYPESTSCEIESPESSESEEVLMGEMPADYVDYEGGLGPTEYVLEGDIALPIEESETAETTVEE